MRRARFVPALLIAIVLALLAAACGDDGDDGAGPGNGDTSAAPTTGTPQAGGTLTIGTFSQTPSLDPVTNIGTGVTGGMELAALYDVLMVYDRETGEYSPRLAESLTSNDDHTVWTLKLRPGVTFTDGTDYDAQAVVFNLQRHIDQRGRSFGLVSAMESFETPDDLTVVITMSRPDSTVPFTLASAPGMIASPTAIEQLGESFATDATGAGAGPFVFASFQPQEAVVLERNPDYWGGEVYLEELRFVNVLGQAPTYEAFAAGTLQAALLRDPAIIARAEDDGFGGLEAVQSAGNTIAINNGVTVTCQGGQPASVCAGRADGTSVPTETVTSDKRLRQAVAAAIDLETLNERVFQGAAPLSTSMFTDLSRWHDPDLEGPEYDLEQAQELVDEVKAEGSWDGTIRVSCHSGMPEWGIAVQTMLERAGFAVQLDASKDVAANTAAVVVRKEYDIACFGVSILDEEPFHAIAREFGFAGYSNPAVDEALADGRSASSDEERQAALDTIVAAYNEDIPFLSIAPVVQLVVLADNVQGATQTVSSVALFDKAWLS